MKNRYEDTELDHPLKELNSDFMWKTSKKQELKKRILMDIENLESNERIKYATNSKKGNGSTFNKRSTFYKRFSLAIVVCLVIVSTLFFTPALAVIQDVYDKIFSSEHIDDTGVRTAVNQGYGQALDQSFYDKKHDITVHFEMVLMDDKETKLLLTYQSEKTDIQNYYLDIFEGDTSINLVVGDERKKLKNVGWGSRYYDRKENKVAEAISFESIKEYEGQNITLEIENLTIYDDNGSSKVPTIWPLSFTLDQSAISKRETVELNKNFSFRGETYKIKKVEFSALETRVVVTGSDTKVQTTEDGMQYKVMSKLEHQLLNARKIDGNYGYIVDDNKSGVFLKSASEKVAPIFSKGEVEGAKDEYIMIFGPVKDRQDSILEVGDDLKIPLTKDGKIEKQAEDSEKVYIDELLAENGFTAAPLTDDEMKEIDLYLETFPKDFPIDRTVIGKVKNHENSKVIEVTIQRSGILSEIQASNPEEAEKVRKERGFSFIPIFLNHD
ncbi:DUF4179 domain-containing protein [Neobacillus sp. 179-C4.2 HS]|uniref:DUF4179 domain-containing protein n=1 Tax=Neobacillus driksii TaxID=3035913 RepID=A0ABV4YYZ1_9BACI|nr:DUF4179 domain-containing protein [Neobacillus sp. 179.-C4.2 HS]MDP5194657.1 DUF4179 domain-containing protein [Neobacillus sp. 179.-C4.2 HS]